MKGKIFNAQEVQAMLNGSKVQFREVVKPQPLDELKPFKDLGYWTNNFEIDEWRCPYQVGQKIFVKESWRAFTGETLGTPLGRMKIYSYQPKEGDIITYKADADLTKDFTTYLSSTTMPQWASRLTLQIKSIGVERLADISEEDAIKEGAVRHDKWTGTADDLFFKDAFRFEWNATHKKPEEKFEANPWVWKIEFQVINNTSQT